MKIMQAKTDDENSFTMPQIMDELEKYEVTAGRKSIYTDFADMIEKFGMISYPLKKIVYVNEEIL